MACSYPLLAYQCSDGSVIFDERPGYDVVRQLTLACRQCTRCLLERSRSWAVRIMHEASLYEHNCFVTLTYDEAHAPISLDYDDYQRFQKRLYMAKCRGMGRSPMQSATASTAGHPATPPGRSDLANQLPPVLQANPPLAKQNLNRFYMAGEYGEKYGRPHFHTCLFNTYFPDQVHLRKTKTGHTLYRSPTLEKLWPYGFSSIGQLTFESAAYVARYIFSKLKISQESPQHFKQKYQQKYTHYINPDTGEITSRKPEFNNMSRNPGIGANWLRKYQSDVYPEGKIVFAGQEQSPPRFYDNMFKDMDPLGHEAMAWAREVEAMAHAADNTPARRQVKEMVAKAKLKTKGKSL